MSQFDWPITQIKRNYGGSPKYQVLFWSIGFLPFAKGGQHLPKRMGWKWHAIENMLGEHIGNLGNILGTHWNQGKMKKNPSPTLKKLKRNKSKAPWMHVYAFPLVAWNFSSKKSSSPFLAWANTFHKKTPYLFIHQNPTKLYL